MTSTINNGLLTAVFNHKGAELQSLVSGNNEYIWEGDPKWWGKHAPVLFPIVGSLKDGAFRHDSRVYKMSRHGFARDMQFTVTDHSSESITFNLEDTSESLQIYPFRFSLKIIYTLLGNNLTTTYDVTNKSTDKMYFSIGAHPAFALTGNISDYSLCFDHPSDPIINYLDQGLLTKDTSILKTDAGALPLHYDLFRKDALVFRGTASRSATLKHLQKPLLTVDFPGFPDLGIWTMPEAPFICIEPWFGHSDTNDVSGQLSEKPGILHLMPQENFRAKFTITIH